MMGGLYDEIRGPSKAVVYAHYADRTAHMHDWSIDPDPDDELACLAKMEQDPDTAEWVLRFNARRTDPIGA